MRKGLLFTAMFISVCTAASYFAAWEFSAGLGWVISALLFVEPVFGK